MMSSTIWERFHVCARILLLGAVSLGPLLSFGALTWDTRTIEQTAQVEATQSTAIFHFRNAGNDPVTITAVKPACGCTVVELAKRTYAPGESGEIRALYTFGGATGLERKTFEVTTSDALNAPETLVLQVTIPELFTYSRRLFIWNLNEATAEHSATITSLKDLAGIDIGPSAPSTTTWRIETLEVGKKYRIFVQPNSSAQPLSVQIPFVARLRDQTTRTLSLFVLVR